MKINDVVSGALAGVISLSVFVHARSFPPMPGQNIGPGLFPQLIAAGMMMCALLLVWRGLRPPGRAAWITLPPWIGNRRTTLRFLLIPVGLAFYVAVAERLGFVPTAFILLITLFLAFAVRLRQALLMAAVGALGIHFLFYKLLKVPLPWGVLNAVAW